MAPVVERGRPNPVAGGAARSGDPDPVDIPAPVNRGGAGAFFASGVAGGRGGAAAVCGAGGGGGTTGLAPAPASEDMAPV
jgi:hypothetical protein